MKKLLLTLIFLLGFISVNAQTYRYKAQNFAYKYVNDNGYWTKWSDWKSCNILITIDTDDDIITIYSRTPQVYVITDYIRTYTDSSNGRQMEFKVIDQDRDIGNVRIRIEANGTSQLYVDFNDVSWVYGNITRY